MPLNNFTRPNLPYVNEPLPNDNRFEVITTVLKQPITVDVFEAEINASVDRDNILDNKIENVVAGNIPGSDNPLNVNKLLTTDGNGTLSFVNVTNSNIGDGSLSGSKITPSSIGTLQLGNGVVTPDKIPNLSLPYGKMNFDDGVLPGDKLFNKSVTQAQLGLLSVGTPELIDNSVKTQKIEDGAITAPKVLNGNITLIKLAQEVLDRLVPIGTIIEFSGSTGLPSIWLECNGQAVDRTTYVTLFANIGVNYGPGNGATTFNLPDRRGKISVGIGSDSSTGGRITNATAPNISLGQSFGSETQILNINQIPAHRHVTNTNINDVGNFTGGSGQLTRYINGGMSGSAGGGLPHPNVQPSMFARYYIRAL